MARRAVPDKPQAADLTIDGMRLGIERLNRRIADVEAFEPSKITKRFSPDVEALQTAIDETLGRVFGHGTIEYNRYSGAARLDQGPFIMGDDPTVGEVREWLNDGKSSTLTMLRQAVKSLEEDLLDRGRQVVTPATSAHKSPVDPRKVFIVHGHGGEVRETVARYLSQLDLLPVILHEQPNKGRTIITKFREEAADIGFAVVLMTPDDHGGKAGEATRPRARQNVVFELGFFIGALGPERVVALVQGDVEKPSDFDGVVYVSLDNGHWKIDLAKELKAANFPIDFNKVMGL